MKEIIFFLKWTGIAFIILISFLFAPLTSHLALAGLVSFQKEYAYQASEYDSKVSCRALAFEQVKRLLLEELGTYLESETEVKNFQLTKDQIVILTAGIVRAEIIDEKWDGKTYYLKAKITADPKDVANSVDKLRQDRQKTKELEETRKKADEALMEIERLKKELQIAKAEKPNWEPYNQAVRRLSARDWFEKGFALAIAHRNQEAIEAYSMAIEGNPKYDGAYSSRANAYRALKNYQRAISDYTLAIGFDPQNATYYSSRADVYEAVGNYQQAKSDLTKAIQLEPNDPWHYFNRGEMNFRLNNHRQAIDDFRRIIRLDIKPAAVFDFGHNIFPNFATISIKDNHQKIINDYTKAIMLNPKDETAHIIRGLAYRGIADSEERDIQDFSAAILLNPKDSLAYMLRGATKPLKAMYQDAWKEYLSRTEGRTYSRENNADIYFQRAIQDYTKVIRLNPKYGQAYYERGSIYLRLGNQEQAINDYVIAARLRSYDAQNYLRSKGISW
jgi:tetratricopeptide (TPR) repeat protein